ncbi:O-acetyl-ADP-ribose deacetylase [Gynuella sunshinyii]|uniref:Putative phosphatase, C-terminal domain of histone macroH2A1-like protein n=1 Tax=Gynuella sunshinyii YC6258 TaxID=1445510 RepID=A0A0C5V8S6_9GAMM|nr:O-acetyl-ADP-ribose deacetylase [Gynuella sunshinyii]AJQ95740.1 putative phosphatase, C-terminal domain of histone macroH2A1-like protein [Gynuella sunshinyii YC6258]
MSETKIIKADITELDVDAIVSAANAALCGGGGVDGAIHRAAGPFLLEECRQLGGCKPGFAKITGGHNLKCWHIIHAVGPVWYGGHKGEEDLLRSCYRESLKLASAHSAKSIAFPAISCGAYRFPVELACKIAVEEVHKWLSQDDSIDVVYFVCFDSKIKQQYLNAIGEQ